MPDALTLKLDRLVELFERSVTNDKLPVEIRSFSAKLMTLAAHVIRIDNSASKAFAVVNKRLVNANTQIAQLTEIVTALAAKLGIEVPTATAPGASTTAPTAPTPTPAHPAAPVAKPTAPAQAAPAAPAATEETDEDEEAAVAQFIAEAQAEVDAINGVSPGVTQ